MSGVLNAYVFAPHIFTHIDGVAQMEKLRATFDPLRHRLSSVNLTANFWAWSCGDHCVNGSFVQGTPKPAVGTALSSNWFVLFTVESTL